jgi:hydroxymethylglutaryl-CoA reductase
MAIEESSVVAAASKSANYWSTRGGFKATVINTEKIGKYIFFIKVMFQNWSCFLFKIKQSFFLIQKVLQKTCKRGGGILDIVLNDKTNLLPNYYQLHVTLKLKIAWLILLIPA